MKRLGSSDSLAGLMSICPNSTDEHNLGNNPMYTREFQTMLEGLDEEGCIEESGHISEKKRRLSVDQVKALEKNFEVENKLEPERKVKLAQELGLQPRQVAVWFQNRRARWKTKQLERDYGVLKADYDGLKLNFDKLKHDNEALLKEIRQLKSNLNEDGSSESKSSMKEEEEDEQTKLETPVNSLAKSCDQAATQPNLETFNVNNNNGSSAIVFADLKDGSSDSDSSAILNDDHNHSPPAAPTNTHHHHHHHHHHQFLDTQQNGSSSSTNINFQFSNSTAYQPQFVKIEEHNFFGEESCSTLFSDDQPPTLHWYCSDEWN